MSIINEALKKADHLKKWKALGGGSAPDSSEASPNQAVMTLEEAAPFPRDSVKFKTSEYVEPPFRVHFEKKPATKSSHFFSTTQIVAIVLLTCCFFALIIGPWFYMWSHQNQSSQKTEPSSVKMVPVINHGVHAVSSESEASKSGADNVHMAMIPIPKTLKQIPLEMQYRLSGTSSVNGERYAVINSKLLRVGESIDGAEVASIEEQRVTLKKGADEFTVKLGGNP